MGKEIKYYYIKLKESLLRRESKLARWADSSYVTVDEDVDFVQYIDINIFKYSNIKNDKPKSSQFEDVRQILKDSFYDHYNLAIKLINNGINSDGEFYILKNKKNWIEVHGYTSNKRHISIDLRDFIEDLWLMVNSSTGCRSRASCRKDGTAISKEQFMIIFRLTLKFLYDPDSYLVQLDTFLKNFYSLTMDGEEVETSMLLSTNQSFQVIIEQLELRKKNIEKRLIEVDDDSETDRIRMRGEIEGINYSINTIKTHQ